MNFKWPMDPGSIAVIGASATEGKRCYEAMKNVAGFGRPHYPLNPNGGGTAFGHDFVGSIGDVDEMVDLAMLADDEGDSEDE